jgi:hypothetical protein
MLPAAPAVPLPLPDPATRLATAIWYSDAFHSADTQRLREWNEAVTRVQTLGSTPRASARRRGADANKARALAARRKIPESPRVK